MMFRPSGSMQLKSSCGPRWSAWLLLALAALLPATAQAAPPATPEFRYDYPGDGTVEVGWRLPAGTRITHHEYRFKEATADSFPGTWTTLYLGGTPCNKPPGPTLTWQECQETGGTPSDYWVVLRDVPNDGLYDFELRAVNDDGASAAMSFMSDLRLHQAPATPEFRYDHPGDGIVEVGWRLPAGTKVTHHEYRFKEAADSSFPDAWTTLYLGGTPCIKGGPRLPWQECGRTGATPSDYWTTLREVPNGARYHFELRAVNEDKASAAMSFTEALPADPDAVVQFEDEVFEALLKRCDLQDSLYRCSSNWRSGGEITQLDMARLVWVALRDDLLLPEDGVVPEGRILGPAGEVTVPEDRVTSIDGMQHALNLQGINISFHSVTDIQPVADLAELNEFAFHGSLLSNSDLRHLVNLADLDQLYLSRRPSFPPAGFTRSGALITDMSSLAGLTKLRWLSLCDQRVNPRHLATFVNVERLTYCRNNLTDVSLLRNMAQAQRMNLVDNEIEDVSPLSAMTELTTLLLDGNLVENIAPLGSLAKLEKAHLSGNPISDVDALVPLATEGRLRIIDLRGTAVSAEDVAKLRGLSMPAPHPRTFNRSPAVLWDRPPAAPTGLTATVENGRATLNWEDPGNLEIAAYQHRYRPGPDAEWSDWEWSVEVMLHPTARRHFHRIPEPDRADRTSWALAGMLEGERHDFELRAVVYSEPSDWAAREAEGAALHQAYEYKPGRYGPIEDYVDKVPTYGGASRVSIVPSPTDPQSPGDGDRVEVDLDDLLGAAPDGEARTCTAASSDPGVTAMIEDGELIISVGEDATPGIDVVSVTVTCSPGGTVVVKVPVEVVEAPEPDLSRPFLRGWRLWLID